MLRTEGITYQDLKSLVQICDLQNTLLELLDQLFLLVCAFLRKVGDLADFVLLLLRLVVQLGVMLGQLSEGLTGGCLDLERFDLF